MNCSARLGLASKRPPQRCPIERRSGLALWCGGWAMPRPAQRARRRLVRWACSGDAATPVRPQTARSRSGAADRPHAAHSSPFPESDLLRCFKIRKLQCFRKTGVDEKCGWISGAATGIDSKRRIKSDAALKQKNMTAILNGSIKPVSVRSCLHQNRHMRIVRNCVPLCCFTKFCSFCSQVRGIHPSPFPSPQSPGNAARILRPRDELRYDRVVRVSAGIEHKGADPQPLDCLQKVFWGSPASANIFLYA